MLEHYPPQTQGPRAQYRYRLQQGDLLPDSEQALVVDQLQELFQRLTAPAPEAQQGLLQRLFARQSTLSSEPGLYIWGGVGRGKTWLMDIFYQAVPDERKTRQHFHRFMHWVHDELDRFKGQPDPLELVADEFAARSRLLCLDEFHVTDIGDAMILARLLKGLYSRGVTLVATSNVPPDELYKNGLQRESFLPAIALLKSHNQVIELGGETDFRLRYLEQAKVYHSPLDNQADACLRAEFDHLVLDAVTSKQPLEIIGRSVPVCGMSDDVVWFEFSTLCGDGRSARDYIELASCFHTVLLSDIPVMGDDQGDRVKRFMHLVDEFYDRNVKLIVSAEAEPEALYHGQRLSFEFQRTASRLREMQSHDYLARGHLAA